MDNGFKYWFDGLPGGTVSIPANSSSTMKYWFDGLPQGTVYITEGAVVNTRFFFAF